MVQNLCLWSGSRLDKGIVKLSEMLFITYVQIQRDSTKS